MQARSDNILYYNAIANEYNDMLNKKPDRTVREKVANKFLAIVREGAVLDFGGGTGLDLEWLSKNYHTVLFCEPSAGMREIAIHNHTNLLQDHVIFLDDSAVDFRQWKLRTPFAIKVDAILLNFAVINCIPGIELLFKNLAEIMVTRGNIIALVLTRSAKKMWRRNFWNMFRSFIYGETVTVDIRYKKHRQTVFIYSIREIIEASEKHFNFCSSEVLAASDYTLVHLNRK